MAKDKTHRQKASQRFLREHRVPDAQELLFDPSIMSQGLVVYEGKQPQRPVHGKFSDAKRDLPVARGQNGSQPTLYLVVNQHNLTETALLLTALTYRGYVTGEKQYRELEQHPAIERLEAYYEAHYEPFKQCREMLGNHDLAFQARRVLKLVRKDAPNKDELDFHLDALERGLTALEAQPAEVRQALKKSMPEIGALRELLDAVREGIPLEEEQDEALETGLEQLQKLSDVVQAQSEQISQNFFREIRQDAPHLAKYLYDHQLTSLNGVVHVGDKHCFYKASYDGPRMRVMLPVENALHEHADNKAFEQELRSYIKPAGSRSADGQCILKVPLDETAIKELDLDKWRSKRRRDFNTKARGAEWAEGLKSEQQDASAQILSRVCEHRGGQEDDILTALAEYFEVEGQGAGRGASRRG